MESGAADFRWSLECFVEMVGIIKNALLPGHADKVDGANVRTELDQSSAAESLQQLLGLKIQRDAIGVG